MAVDPKLTLTGPAEITCGDYGVSLTGACLDDTSPVDLSGATLELHIQRADSTVLVRTPTAQTGVPGGWTYSLQAIDTLSAVTGAGVAGTYRVDVEVTTSGTGQTYGPQSIYVNSTLRGTSAAGVVTSVNGQTGAVQIDTLPDDTGMPAGDALVLGDSGPEWGAAGLTDATLAPLVTNPLTQTGAAVVAAVGPATPTQTQPALLLTAANGGQGLASDGSYLYWGKDNGTGNGSIIKLDPSTGAAVATFTAPQHAAGVDYSSTRKSLFATSSGTSQATWEIDVTTGAKLRQWDFSTLRPTGNGGLVAWDDSEPAGDVIYQLVGETSTDAFQINRIQVHDDGTFTDQGIYLNSTSLGTLQGMTCRNGSVYLLVDDPSGPSMHTVHQFTRSGSTLNAGNGWTAITSGESEGLTFHNGTLCYGDGALHIWNTAYQAYHDLVLTHGTIIRSTTGVPSGASPEVLLEVSRTAGGNSSIMLDAPSGADAFIYLSGARSGRWDIRAAADGTLQARNYSSGTGTQFKLSPNGDLQLGPRLILSGTGSPEGVKTAPVGSLYTATDGGPGTTLWVKESGTGNTGWAAK